VLRRLSGRSSLIGLTGALDQLQVMPGDRVQIEPNSSTLRATIVEMDPMVFADEADNSFVVETVVG
jgi:hypothetical protein